jgi:hypothetical protein
VHVASDADIPLEGTEIIDPNIASNRSRDAVERNLPANSDFLAHALETRYFQFVERIEIIVV